MVVKKDVYIVLVGTNLSQRLAEDGGWEDLWVLLVKGNSVLNSSFLMICKRRNTHKNFKVAGR